MDVGAEDDREHAVAEIAGPAEGEARGQQGSEDEPPDEGGGDRVEHDRRDDLVGT